MQIRLHHLLPVGQAAVALDHGGLGHDHRHTVVVEARSAGAPDHLEDRGRVHFDVALGRAVVLEGALDHHEVRGQVDTLGLGSSLGQGLVRSV